MRIVVGLHPAADAAEVAAALRARGATTVGGPTASLPGVLVADLSGEDLDAALADAKALPGVRYAEADALRFTQT